MFMFEIVVIPLEPKKIMFSAKLNVENFDLIISETAELSKITILHLRDFKSSIEEKFSLKEKTFPIKIKMSNSLLFIIILLYKSIRFWNLPKMFEIIKIFSEN